MIFPIKIGAGRETYFAHGPSGHWNGQGASRLGCEGRVDLKALGLLLRGSDPSTEVQLPGLGRNRRRAGYELIVAAPKSLSLLATLGGDGRTGIVTGAHQAAVTDVITYLEANAPVVRLGAGRTPGAGWVAATFDHRRNAAGEPHLHSHVVIANLVATPQGWRCISPGPALWEELRAAEARYFVAVDAHLRANGLVMNWERTQGQTLEVAGIPREAVLGASSRRMENPRPPGPSAPSET